MAIDYFTGFEVGGFADVFSTSGTVNVQSSIVKTGTYAARAQATGTALSYIGIKSLGSASQFVNILNVHRNFRFWFRYATGPSSGTNAVFASSSSNNVNLRLNSDGTIALYDSSTLRGTSTATLGSGTWYMIDIIQEDANDVIEIHVNGNMEITATYNSGFAEMRLGRAFAPASQSNTLDFFYDDVVVSTYSSGNNVAIPAGAKVAGFAPTGNGSAQGWTTGTGTTFAEVDDYSDDDTTYWGTNTTNTLHLATFSPSIPVGSTVHSVIAMVRPRRTGTATTQISIKNNATRVDQAMSLASSYSDSQFIRNTDVDGDTPWTVADLSTMEMGIRVAAYGSGQIRTTSLHAKVLYEEVEPELDLSVAGQFAVFFP